MLADSSNSLRNARARQGHILVVEDKLDNWDLIQAASRQAMPDVEVVWASSADAALAHLTACTDDQQPLPRLMLLDLYLPEAEPSWHLLRTLRKPRSPYIWMPIVLISHSDRPSDINEFYSLGGTSYIVKPATYEQWVSYFDTVRQYWWETVTLPAER